MNAIFNFSSKYDVIANSDLENFANIRVINVSGPIGPSGSNVKIYTDSYSVVSNSYVTITAEVD